MQSPNATITSACRASVSEIRATLEGAALYRAAIAEVVAVGRAARIAFPADAEARAFAIVESMPIGAKSSMQVDFERGLRVELEELTGAVTRLGRAHGVSTPTFSALYAVLAVRRALADSPA
jgi:2-dehydropantoate 2-reductase